MDDDDAGHGNDADGDELDVGDDFSAGPPDDEPTSVGVPETTIVTSGFAGGRFLDDFDDDDGGSEPADATVEPSKGWWIAPVAILAIIAVIGIIGAALDNNDNNVATTAAVATSTSTSTSTSIDFSTATTAPADTSTTVEATLPTVTPTTAAGSATTTAGAAANSTLTISASYSNQTPAVGEEVVFDVTVRDPDAGPINECGGSPPGGFGDSDYAAGCSPDCSVASTRSASEATYQYKHTYTAPGTYTVRFSYQSAGGCTNSNPYASTRTLSFDITVS